MFNTFVVCLIPSIQDLFCYPNEERIIFYDVHEWFNKCWSFGVLTIIPCMIHDIFSRIYVRRKTLSTRISFYFHIPCLCMYLCLHLSLFCWFSFYLKSCFIVVCPYFISWSYILFVYFFISLVHTDKTHRRKFNISHFFFNLYLEIYSGNLNVQ